VQNHSRSPIGRQPGGSSSAARQLTSQVGACANPKQLLKLLQQQKLEQEGGVLNAIHISAVYYKLGQLCQRDNAVAKSAAAQQLLQLLDRLLPAVEQQLVSKPRELSNIVWACAYAQHPVGMQLPLQLFLQPQLLSGANAFDMSNVMWALGDREVRLDGQQLQQLLDAYTSQLHSAIPQGITNVLWGVAKLQQQVPPGRLQLMVTALVSHADRARLQDISNTVWAVGKMGLQLPEQQLRMLLHGLGSRLHLARPQEISNTLLGVSYMGQQVPQQQLQLLLSAFTAQLGVTKPQEMSSILYAVAAMGQQVPQQQLQLLLSAFTAQLGVTKPQEMSDTLYAVAAMGQQVPQQQLQLLLSAFTAHLGVAKPHATSNTLYAVAAMGQQVPEQQLQLILAALEKTLQVANPQHVSNSLWACARFRHVPGQLLAALQEQRHFERFLSHATPQHLANTAWACGQLGYSSSILLDGIMQQTARLLQQHSSFETQHYCNLCWAVAVLDMQQHVPAVLQLAQACSSMWDEVEANSLRQLHQVHIWLQQLQMPQDCPGLTRVLSEQQLAECTAGWEQQLNSNAANSALLLQQQVMAALQQLPSSMWQGEMRMESVTPDGNLSIDIAAVSAAGHRGGWTHSLCQPWQQAEWPHSVQEQDAGSSGVHSHRHPLLGVERLQDSRGAAGVPCSKLAR
jgi:hypothetical protein